MSDGTPVGILLSVFFLLVWLVVEADHRKDDKYLKTQAPPMPPRSGYQPVDADIQFGPPPTGVSGVSRDPVLDWLVTPHGVLMTPAEYGEFAKKWEAAYTGPWQWGQIRKHRDYELRPLPVRLDDRIFLGMTD